MSGSMQENIPPLPACLKGSHSWVIVPSEMDLDMMLSGEEAELQVVNGKRVPENAMAVQEGITDAFSYVVVARGHLDRLLKSMASLPVGQSHTPETIRRTLDRVREAFGGDGFRSFLVDNVATDPRVFVN